MVCAECGRDVVQAKTGRPRKYCSRSCQARGYRRRRDEGRLSAAAAAISSGGASPSLIDAAISMADTRGIRALTLRTLARDRGIAMSALQHDLGSRDRLVALMVQQIFRESTSQSRSQDGEDAPVDEEPVDALLRSADEEWQAYRAHPWLVEVMTTTRPPLVPAVLASVQAVIGPHRHQLPLLVARPVPCDGQVRCDHQTPVAHRTQRHTVTGILPRRRRLLRRSAPDRPRPRDVGLSTGSPAHSDA